MRDKVSKLEYVFCDTGEELPETYEYLFKLEAQLGLKIVRLNPERNFRYYLKLYKGMIPDSNSRWCTRLLKLLPFENYVGLDSVLLYVGIRADESSRKGYVSKKPNIKPVFPFVKDGIMHNDVMRILKESGIGLPEYYKWRSRSGCYFCFFQQRREWVALLENHPDLYWQAAKYEKSNQLSGRDFTWIKDESLTALASNPVRIKRIKDDYLKRINKKSIISRNSTLLNVFDEEDINIKKRSMGDEIS